MSDGGRLAALTSALGATALVAGGVVLGAHPAAPAAAVAARSVQVPAGPTALVCPGPPQALSQGTSASGTGSSAGGTGSSASSSTARGVQLAAAGASLTATALTTDDDGGAGDVSGSGSSTAPAPTSATSLGSLLSVVVPGGDGGLLSAAPVAGRPAVVAGATTALATTGAQRGLSTPPCRAPSPDAWLVGGTAGAGHALSLVLADASSTATTVDVTVLTARGPLQPAALQGLSVGPGQQRSLVLAGVVPASGPLALRVRSSGAGVAAWLDEQVVDGLVAGGTDVVVPSAAPARHMVVTGVLAGAGQSPPVLRLADPGTAPLVARYSVAGAGTSGASGSGTGASAAVAVPAGGVVEVPLRGLAPGASAVTVDAGAPVLASVRLDTSPTTTAADAAAPATTPAPTATTPASSAASAAARSSGDLAWATASAPVTAPTLVALPPATSSSSSAVLDDQLVVTAAGGSAATLDVRVVDAAGTPGPARRLVVPAGTTLGADVDGLAAPSSSSAPVALLLAPVGGSPVTAALVTARTATTSGAATGAGAGQDAGTGVGDLLSVAAVSPPGPVAGRLRVQLASTP